jgi:hypothetical protein
MNTVDNFFITKLAPANTNYDMFLAKDRKILISFWAQLTQKVFFTERQANLLVKILKENKKQLVYDHDELNDLLNLPTWSQPFRVVKKFREIYINTPENTDIVVKFNFDKSIKDKLYHLASQTEGKFVAVSATEFKFSLNEHNLMMLLHELQPYKFNVDDKIQKIYEEINNILNSPSCTFDIFKTTHEKLLVAVKKSVGEVTPDNLLLLHDRKFRFQYKISEKIEENTLTAKIASRESTKIFINSDHTSLTSVISSLKELNRLPALVVFEGHDNKVNKKTLDLLVTALEENKLTDQVGIYFRFETANDTAGFNKVISEHQFNKPLTGQTEIVGIANNKLPKFMLSSDWRPETVISFSNNFKSNKAAIYCSNVDLTIFYSTLKPLGTAHDIL